MKPSGPGEVYLHSFYLISLFAFLLCSCEYQSSEVYNRPVNRDIAPPQIQVVELNIDVDTLYIYRSMEVKFKFKSDHQAITMTRYLIDGKAIGKVDSGTGSFTISGTSILEGLHDLTIEVYTSSGTGSLADELGAEAFVSSNTWKLVIWNTYNPMLTKTVENGLLHIKWKPFLASNFKEYSIGKWGENGGQCEITRIKTGEFIDSTYVGERTRYFVAVITQDDLSFDLGELYMDDDMPRMFFSAGDSNEYFVKWNRPKYYNAVDSYVLYQESESDYYVSRKVKSTNQIKDTLYRFTEGIFGELHRFRLRIVPKKTNIEYYPGAYDLFESGTEGCLGFRFKLQDDYPYCLKVNRDEIIYYNCDTLTRYSISQHRAVDKFAYHDPDGCTYCYEKARISNTGKFMISYVGCNGDILLTKGTDLQQSSVHKLQNITQGGIFSMAVSDTGIMIIVNINGGLSLYDLPTSTPLGHYPNTYTGDDRLNPLKISPTGEYFFVTSDTLRLVQFKNGKFTEVWKPNSNTIGFYDFDSQNPDQLVIWDGSKLSVRLCSDFSLVTEFPLSEEWPLDIDYTTREILTFSSGHLYVRNLADGKIIKDVPTNINPLNYNDNCYLVNHTIVSVRGLLYFIQ